MIRRFGAPPIRGKSYTIRVGAYALLPKGKHLLLTSQSNPGPDLQLPGGGIDPGESPICALHREVFEETGWHISNPKRVGIFRRFVFMPEYDLWAEKICLVYIAYPTIRIGPPTEPAHQAVWMDPAAAAVSLGNAGDRHYAAILAKSVKRL